jgi:hypothetical protein
MTDRCLRVDSEARRTPAFSEPGSFLKNWSKCRKDVVVTQVVPLSK